MSLWYYAIAVEVAGIALILALIPHGTGVAK